MQVAVVAVALLNLGNLLAQAVLAVEQTERLQQPFLLRHLQILVAVAAVLGKPGHLHFRAQQAAQAALASLSLSTTSALPQSSPSSHRRSGLHQRVR
jgi:hypothetical protein